MKRLDFCKEKQISDNIKKGTEQMICLICGSKEIKVEYKGIIRDGGLGRYTEKPVPIMRCMDCGVIWHGPIQESKEYYESEQYRNELEGSSEENEFYRLHDKESLDKFLYTGTDVFRNNVVMDIGCGCGAFLDFVRGVAKKVVAIEPSETYRKIMDNKGFNTYPYTCEALLEWKEKVDVITSFDVIEHVSDPLLFVRDIHELLCFGGKAIIGTPTDAPIMRSLLGAVYEQKLLFSTQHLWIFGEKNLRLIAERSGFNPEEIKVRFFQRYGIGNMLGWLRTKEPRSDINDEWVTDSLDAVWKKECEEHGLADYIVLYLEKK